MSSFITTHLQKIGEIARRHGVTTIRVFGSSAVGTRREDSDVDLLIELESGRSLLDLVGFKQDLEELFGVAVDVVTENALSPYLRDEILATAQPLDIKAA